MRNLKKKEKKLTDDIYYSETLAEKGPSITHPANDAKPEKSPVIIIPCRQVKLRTSHAAQVARVFVIYTWA